MNNTKEKLAYRWLLGKVVSARNSLIAALILGLLNAVLMILQASFLASIIHKVIIENIPVVSLEREFLLTLLVILLRGGCAWGREYFGFLAGAEVRRQIRQVLLDKIRRLGPQFVGEQQAGSWSSIVVEQVEELQEFIARYLPQMVLAVAIPVIILVVVFPQSWVAGLIFLITAPLIPVFMMFVGQKASEANRRNFQSLARLGGFFLDRLQGLETLRYFSVTEKAEKELAAASEDFRLQTMQVLRLAFLSSTILEFFASISIAMVAVYLGMSLLGHIEFGFYDASVSLYSGLFLLLLAPEFYQPLRELGTYYHAKAKAVGASESILEVINREEPEAFNGTGIISTDHELNLEVNDMSVKAPGTGITLLDSLSFNIEAGQKVAIIGSSGAGKTTLINTLMGFIPFEGLIALGGQSLSDTDLASWRKQIAWLGQHPLIIYGSVFENIAFGRKLTETQCRTALMKAQGADILEALPNGMHSILREEGSNLSVGQAQRIALARAIVEPVKLLVLDEPTASLDQASESLVLDALNVIGSECTVITITHRLNQLSFMDQVLMLKNGRLVADGSPEQLAADSPGYQEFQAAHRESLDND